MLCYRDRTYCNRGEGCTCSPSRRLTDAVMQAAQAAGLPVSMGVLCGKDGGA